MRFKVQKLDKMDERGNNTYPIGITSAAINLSLPCVESNSRKPTYNHIIALVGLMAQAKAAKAKAHFLESWGTFLEETCIQGQYHRLTSVRTVSKQFDNVRLIQKKMNQFAN